MGDFTEDDKEYFRQTIFYAAEKVGYQALADEFKVSPGTIGRWIGGRSMPPESVRKNIQERVIALLKETNEKQKKEDFKKLVSKASVKLGPHAVCELFSVSISTVRRWMAGTHWIHPLMMDGATQALRNLLETKKAD